MIWSFTEYAQVVPKPYDDLPDHQKDKGFFDNCFKTSDILHQFRSKEIHALGTIQLNSLGDFLLDENEDLIIKDLIKMAEALWITLVIATLLELS